MHLSEVTETNGKVASFGAFHHLPQACVVVAPPPLWLFCQGGARYRPHALS